MRQFILLSTIFTFIFLLNSCNSNETNEEKPAIGLVKYVNPFIGTGGHGHTFPGATMPFGMVQLSPDTRLEGWDGCGGYHFTDSIIYGFSHTHLSGTGIPDYGDVLFMPNSGKIYLNNGFNGKKGYSSKFKKENEKAEAGYYSVLMENKIRAELTSTLRAGMHQYTFPEGDSSHFILDLLHRDKVLDSEINILSDSEISGFRISSDWAAEQHIYFYAQFSKAFKSSGIAINEKIKAGLTNTKGKNLKAYFLFDTEENEKIILKVGISAVSIEGAKQNLQKEIPDFDFQKIKKQNQMAWEKQLSKIEVSGESIKDQKTIFYTALYHSMIAPNLFMDVDKNYRGMDKNIHKAIDYQHHTVFSLWDTYRATHPLFTIIEQKRTTDFIKTFLSQFEQGGRLPMWELAANYTNCMIGYHAIPVIADAYKKDIRDFDVQKAYNAMKHSANRDYEGLDLYRKYGFIPAEKEGSSVSKMLEYAYDDWCIAQMALELGNEKDFEIYTKRAQFYKNIFDKKTGFMRAKLHNRWFSPFDPSEVNYNYTEANCWQYSFYVPQDISGFMNLLGGKNALDKKLDQLFTTSSETSGRHQPDITGLIGQYAHGNEPSHHMAYLYNYVGKAWKTQEKVREILETLYWNNPEGLSGNEDCGQMSSWYVLSALGFYSVTPGSDVYAIGVPNFEEAKINLENGKSFIIKTLNLNPKNIYIQSAKLNGKKYDKSFIKHEDILNGGELIFEMGNTPNKAWASNEKNCPVTKIEKLPIVPVPFIAKGEKTFFDSIYVELGSIDSNSEIFFEIDSGFQVYEKPILLSETSNINFYTEKNGEKSAVLNSTFYKIPKNRKIEIKSEYANQYAAGGNLALIDFIRGNDNFQTGSWQGYEGQDLEFIVDLGESQGIKKLALGCLQDQNSWIWMPEMVEFSVSLDGEKFTSIGKIYNEIDEKADGGITFDFEQQTNTKARFIKVFAKSKMKCPEWHKGAGGKCWIFVDELIVE